jgi:hypothetical protein
MGKNQLYYSNHCQHSQRLLKLVRDNALIDTFSFICVDDRRFDPKTQLLMAVLKNGQAIPIPINVTKVPSLLLVNDKYQVVYGCDSIMKIYSKSIDAATTAATQGQGEPMPASTALSSSSSSSLTGVSVNSVSTLTPLLPANNSGSRIKEGDVDIKELAARRNEDIELTYNHNNPIPYN